MLIPVSFVCWFKFLIRFHFVLSFFEKFCSYDFLKLLPLLFPFEVFSCFSTSCFPSTFASYHLRINIVFISACIGNDASDCVCPSPDVRTHQVMAQLIVDAMSREWFSNGNVGLVSSSCDVAVGGILVCFVIEWLAEWGHCLLIPRLKCHFSHLSCVIHWENQVLCECGSCKNNFMYLIIPHPSCICTWFILLLVIYLVTTTFITDSQPTHFQLSSLCSSWPVLFILIWFPVILTW